METIVTVTDSTCHSMQLVKKHYGHSAREDGSLRITFEDREITMSIPEDGLTTKEHWRITPFSHPTVSRKWIVKFTVILLLREFCS